MKRGENSINTNLEKGTKRTLVLYLAEGDNLVNQSESIEYLIDLFLRDVDIHDIRAYIDQKRANEDQLTKETPQYNTKKVSLQNDTIEKFKPTKNLLKNLLNMED